LQRVLLIELTCGSEPRVLLIELTCGSEPRYFCRRTRDLRLLDLRVSGWIGELIVFGVHWIIDGTCRRCKGTQQHACDH